MTRKFAVLAVLMLFVGVGTVTAQRPNIAADHYFVGFTGPINANDEASLRSQGIALGNAFPQVQAIEVLITNRNQLNAIQRNPRVAYVEVVPMRYADSLSNAELTPTLNNGLYGLVTTKAVDVHVKGITGMGIKVGVADTAIDCDHPDIHDNLLGRSINKVGNGRTNGCWQAGDTQELHATHVAGTLLGVLSNTGIHGVAYDAELYHARVLGASGGTASDVMAGVQWLVDQGVRIVNLSLGGGFSSRTEENFYKKIHSQGVLVVAAAGNDGKTKLSYPAGYSVNIAVGAVDRNNALASFSNTGRNLDVVAPGVGVLSSVPRGYGNESSVTAGTTYAAFGLQYANHTSGITASLVNCGLASTNTGCSVSGKIALIQRGDTTFAQKVTNVMDQGAIAAIIYNNVSGDFSGTLGSETTSDGRVWIPAVSVSSDTGSALVTQTSATVVSMISDWDTYDGTSMATPHVAGTLALIWSANSGLSNSTVENYLYTTCTDLGTPGYDRSFGYGLINALAAVQQIVGQ
jgi:subtilisin family serine protease